MDATIQQSPIWENVETLSLQQNMRLQQGTADVQQFSRWLLEVGHGLEMMTGNVRQYISTDEMVQEAGADPDDGDNIPVEFLRSINSSSLPPGELNLKIGCPIILLQNLSPSMGLCNGTQMVITQMSNRVLEARLMGGEHDGEIAMIP